MSEEFKDKAYLGDSVYIAHDGYHVVLTTENGYGATNTIFLEPNLIDGIKKYYVGIIAKYSKPEFIEVEVEDPK